MSESEEGEFVSIVGICGGKGENKKKEKRPSVRLLVRRSYFLHEPQRSKTHNGPSSHEIIRQIPPRGQGSIQGAPEGWQISEHEEIS